MKNTHKKEIYVGEKAFTASVDMVQYDTGNILELTINDMEIPRGAKGTSFFKKPSGKFVYDDTGVTISENKIIVPISNQAIAESGVTMAQVSVMSGTDIVSTFGIRINVSPSYSNSSAEPSRTVMNAFDEATALAIAKIGDTLDPTLKIPNKAADAAAVGNAIEKVHDIPDEATLKAIIDAIFADSVAGSDGKTLDYDSLVRIMNNYIGTEAKGTIMKIGGILKLVNGDVIYTEGQSINYAVNASFNYLYNRIKESGGYTLPQMTQFVLGGAKAGQKTAEDTQPVHIDSDGFMWTKPGAVSPSGNLPFYNATDYGVSASNSDNTDAINSVLNAAYESGGGTVVLPAGIIKTLPFDMRSKVSVIGQGMFATTLSFLGTSQSGRPSAVFFPEDAIGCEFAHLALYGNWTAQNGIDCANIVHSGGFGENDYSDALFSNPTNFIKYKSSHLHHLFIAKFGYQVDYLMPANTVVGWGIYHHEQSNYCFDMSNIWVYQCQNGIKCMGTDSSLTNSYVEKCHFQGLWLQGGNSKYQNIKVVWNGNKWDGSGELFAIDMDDATQYLSIMNLECQDNYCDDIRLKGIGHEIHCFADGSRDVRKNYKIKCENLRGSILDVRLTNYVGHESDNYKATYDLAMSNCHHNKVNAIIMPNVAKNQGTVDNVNGDTNIIRM